MQRPLIVKSLGLGGASDLTLLAPLKPGFVPSLDSVTYKTRVKRVLAELHGARQAAHEYATARLLSDAVERVGVIHSVRVAVMEPEDEVLLSVTFDGPWEAYVRVLWDKVGALLDLIFCNTRDYPTACEHSFEQWAAWARGVQRETGFFYGPPQASAQDMLYERRLLRMRERRAPAGSAVDELRAVLPSAEEAVDRLTSPVEDTVPDDPPLGRVDMLRMGGERVRTGLQALAGLYRLTDLYVPGTEDGPVLWRAAVELLREFLRMRGGPADADVQQQRERFERALDWLFTGQDVPALVRERPKLPRSFAVDAATAREVQGGILRAYEQVTHGALLLLRFDTADAAATFVARLLPVVTRDEQDHHGGPGTLYRNIAFTPAGLRAMGMDEDSLALFPEAFLQGMALRAGALGDVRHNHPRRWRLPGRFQGIDSPAAPDAVDLGGVHAVVQLRTRAADAAAMATNDLHEAGHPLRDEVRRLAAVHAGARVLAVQGLRRRYEMRGGVPVVVEHFGYADGGGQPDLEWNADRVRKANRVPLGDVLWGHPGQADFGPDAGDPRWPWMGHGSFLVLRKYRQFPQRLDAAVARTAADMQARLGGSLQVHRETVYAKLMGRRRDDGAPLAAFDASDLNDFDFDDDPQGRQCPLHAHIRRAHPRRMAAGAERLPRIVRRGMSFGPDADPDVPDDRERGLVFMAYTQSLSEQFEVVQRWLVGGNSTGSTSATACPIVGVPENGYPRVFRFEAEDAAGGAHVFTVELEARTALFEEPAVPTQLEWGLYLFAPSIASLRLLADMAKSRAADRARAVPWEAPLELRRAQTRIRELLSLGEGRAAVDAWKAALEDPDAIDRQQAAALWAAIRLHHGGALRTAYGTLVADRQLALDVFRDPHRRYSVSGQRQRMKDSFGDIYLGLDDGPDYREQSERMNRAIGELGFDTVYAQARDAAKRKIDAIVALARRSAKVGEAKFETLFDAREVMDAVLADLTEHWFGLQDRSAAFLARGSTDWSWKDGDLPLYPGHYTALSRNMFQPHPGRVPADLAGRYGRALRSAMKGFVESHASAARVPQAPGTGRPAPLAQVAFGQMAMHDADFVGRLINGVVMGYTPTIIGAVANVLLEWRRTDRFGALRSALAGRTDPATAQAELSEALRDAARTRPMPQLTWRTVTEAHDLVTVDGRAIALNRGDTVVLAIVGGTQQSLADGESDGKLMFGGCREPGGPTHACPGYQAGIAAMLGSIVAILARPEALREGPSPLTYSIEGPMDEPAQPALRLPPGTAARVATFATFASFMPPAPPGNPPSGEETVMPENPSVPSIEVPAAGSRTGLVLAWGDSWLAYELGGLLPLGTDLRDFLVRFGYRVPRAFCDFSTWGTIKKMAAAPEEFCAALDHAITPRGRPSALLLSGGGNDSTRSALAGLLNPKGTGPVLDAARTAAHIEQLRRHFVGVLGAIKTVYEDADVEIPVLIPGYDHPVPNGKGVFPLQREWLFDVFQEAGYAVGPLGVDRDAASTAMAQLIDLLNEMMSQLRGEEFPFVRHVDLRGTAAQWAAQSGADGWQDDLHPVDEVFEMMAAKIDAAVSG